MVALFAAFLVVVPPATPPPAREALERRLDRVRTQLEADVGVAINGDVEVVLCATTDEFVARAGRSRREAAAFADGRLYLQPLAVLGRLADLDGTLRHELAHALIVERWRRCAPAPRWLHEGLATLLADSGPVTRATEPALRSVVVAPLGRPRDDAERAWAYAAARRLVETRGGRRLLDHCPR
jgi:hypothetical protein